MTSPRDQVPLSFEVYPPRSSGKIPELQEAILALGRALPDFISVTFGAGGSSAKDSLDVLTFIRDNTSATPLAHITCVGSTKREATNLIHSFLAEDIRHFLALRGDLPAGTMEHVGELAHATNLIELITDMEDVPTPPERIAVAAFPNGHPESASVEEDIATLLAKQDAGATLAITQLFFYPTDYARFVEKTHEAGVTIPILPGIMPITSMGRLERVLELTGEARPHDLALQLWSAQDRSEQEKIGIDWSASMVGELVEMGAPGIHLYAFNQHATVLSVLEQAGVR
jgi:methylenetetrahydrofolate reductase (NADPH)